LGAASKFAGTFAGTSGERKGKYQQMALTDLAIRNTKDSAKPQKLSDGGGLNLIANALAMRLFFAENPPNCCRRIYKDRRWRPFDLLRHGLEAPKDSVTFVPWFSHMPLPPPSGCQ
jgi:hypothetical protein